MKQMSSLRWLWNQTRCFRLVMVTNSVVGIVRVGVSLSMVWVCKHLVDAATHEKEELLGDYLVVLVICLVAQLVLAVAYGRLESRMEIGMRNRLESNLFGKLMRSKLDERDSMHSADLINRLEQDVPVVTGMLCRELPYVASGMCQLLGAFFFLYFMEAYLAFILIGLTPVVLVASRIFMKKMRLLSSEIRRTDSEVQVHLQESLQHRLLITILEYVLPTERKLGDLQTKLQQQVMRRTDFTMFSRTVVQGGFSVGYLIAFVWGAYGLLAGTVSFGMMTAFLQLVAQVQRPMYELSRQLPALARTLVSVERLEELEALPEESTEPADKLMVGNVGIRMEQVHFSYPDGDRCILEHFSHDFEPGSFTAIVGATGIGKSTLFKLLLGLYAPESGKVMFYSQTDPAGVTASAATRCNLSYVPQNNRLICGTIRENLLMGNPTATEEELREALHRAVADFVYTLPQGINTQCGEQNSGLSEGQVQRIAIARALLRHGNILLLDEPTSALDKDTEKLLLNRLSSLGKTVIMITHSEYVVGYCSRIVRLNS